jgi:hypothetical protein
MANNVYFLDYYLSFANNHPTIKKIIEEDNLKLVLHSKNSKNKELLNTDYKIIFNNYYIIADHLDNVKYNRYVDYEKLEKQIEINQMKVRLKKIIKNLCYEKRNNYYNIKIPMLIIIKNKQFKKYIDNTVTNIHCVSDELSKNDKFKFPTKIMSYLPNSTKVVSMDLRTIYFIRIENKYHNNLPNKLKVFSCDSYPGINWKDKIKLPLNTILIIKSGCFGTNYVNNDDNIKYSTIKSHITIIKNKSENIIYYIKEPNKKLVLYEQEQHDDDSKKHNITFTMKEI